MQRLPPKFRTIALWGLLAVAGKVAAGEFPDRGLAVALLTHDAQTSEQFLVDGDRRLSTAQLRTPLGSVWKLYVYLYVTDREIATPDFTCTGRAETSKQELYCCDPGDTITRDVALNRSCGLYFSPQRLKLDADDWRRYWQRLAPQTSWLHDINKLEPATWVDVDDLLRVLIKIDSDVRRKTEQALLSVMLNGRGHEALRYLGGRFRVKTYTWQHPEHEEQVIGGAAGWLSDGRAIWLGARGSSVTVLKNFAPALAALTANDAGAANTAQCVDVRLFARYPIRDIRPQRAAQALVLGADRQTTLQGNYVVRFANGNTLRIHSDGEVIARTSGDNSWQLHARLSEQEYVARVIDREGDARHREAARALAIVARSYLRQNAMQRGECLSIADSSRAQRVSPRPATVDARLAADFSDGLILQNAVAQYRKSTQSENILSWQHAVEQDTAGAGYIDILRRAFSNGALATLDGASECTPLSEAQQWLASRQKAWRRAVQTEPGYNEPKPQVCALSFGNPYSDNTTQRIFVRGLHSLNNRLALAHEYLHLAFADFPSGRDEHYIEQWARRLIQGDVQ